ncbi:flagellar hook-length control protein FliK [Nitratidesulfovibrio sp. SRB-5]|uniref:flagellar hook-length control protein FliK n=1 Tax=Nitratidesulfovibrio sp. SRB-5 TaxID=2872636 RepID=UPI0010266B0A|nr:flagellar hook-length control protein FliK [Nitratidesulfovibrio sp. SRB-5]MBZ2171631.1 flagellar hook-length control protein FliK [Nitratidesulfovibrio sp. SRB-5]RXF78061.1 flagellar hook-length control protein FliK [Desulfovibrio sp. DS-1]
MHIFPFLPETAKAPSDVTRRPKVTASTLDFASVLADKASPRSLSGAGTTALRTAADAATEAKGKVRRGEDGGVLTAPGQISLSYQDVIALRNQLEKSGVSPDRLERLTQMASTPGNYSLGQVISALRKDGPYANLNADGTATTALNGNQRLDAKQFLQKIGMLPEEADGMLAQMDAGNTDTVWKAVSSKLSSKTDGDAIDVNVAELEAMAKGLRLSPEVLAAMKTLFGGQTEISTNAAGLKSALVPAGQEMAAREQADRNLASALGSALDPVLQAAKKSAERIEQADRRGDRTAQRSKVLIREAATGKGNGSGVAPALDAERHDGASANAGKTRQSGLMHTGAGTQEHAGRQAGQTGDALQQNASPHNGNGGTNGQQAQTAQGNAQAQAFGLDKQSGQSSQSGDGKGSAWQQDQHGRPASGGSSDPWAELLRKIDISPAFSGAAQSMADASASAANAAGAAQRQGQALTPYLSEQAAAQLERGILTSMQDGTRQLTMKLDPGELGNVTVTLSVRNGEVNATIRPDRTETAQAINDQLHVLRTALEQQGLKVDRLEVQTQLQDNSLSQAWQDAAQHNASQEQQTRNAERERYRRLRRLRDGDDASGAQSVDMAAAAAGRPATLTASGLDIIA